MSTDWQGPLNIPSFRGFQNAPYLPPMGVASWLPPYLQEPVAGQLPLWTVTPPFVPGGR
jgi:hypothetical protein